MVRNHAVMRLALPLAVAAGLGLGAAMPAMQAATCNPLAPQQALAAAATGYADGTYTAEGKGIGGKVPVTVTVSGGVIIDVTVGDNSETQGIGSKAIEQLPALIVEANGTEGVDAVSGASVTSKAIFTAVEDCLEQAGTVETSSSDSNTSSDTSEELNATTSLSISQMSLDELIELREEIDARIDELQAASADDSSAASTNETGIWEVKYYVDDFQEPTDDGYVRSETITGTFSNSATTNSECDFVLVVDDWSITLFAYEYGWSQVQGTFGDTSYTVKIRTGNGDEFTASASLDKGDDRIYIGLFDSETREKILSALQEGGKISFLLTESDAYGVADSYLFTIDDASGFSAAYNQLYGETA